MGLIERFGIKAFSSSTTRPAVVSTPAFREGWVDMSAKDLPHGEVKGAVLGIDDTIARILDLGNPNALVSPAQFFRAYKDSSAVAIPINLVAENFAQVNPVLENMETGETEQSHELLDLLRRPHSLFSRSLFLETMAKHYLIAGEAPVVALGGITKPPAQLQPINPKNVQGYADTSTGLPSEWKITGNALSGVYKTKPIDMGRVFSMGTDRALKVIRSFSTEDDSLLRGQSKLVSAAKDVWQQLQGADYNLSLLRQGGRASLIFQFKNALKPEVFRDRRRQIIDQAAGADNAGRVIVTHGGEVDITEASASSRDMEYQAGMQMARNALAQTFKVPIVLTTTDAATFNNFENGKLALWDDAILPVAGTLLGDLGEWLLPLYGTDPRVWRLTFDKMQVDSLRSRFLTELKVRMDLGVESINEIRASLPGLDRVEGGDEILVSGALTPLSAVVLEVDDVLLPPSPTPPSPAGVVVEADEPALLEDLDVTDG